MKYILITGTNSGIGEKTSEFLLQKGYHVFGSVREKKAAVAKAFLPIPRADKKSSIKLGRIIKLGIKK